KARPMRIGLLGAQAVVQIPQALAQLAEQARRLQGRTKQRCAGFAGIFVTVHTYSIAVKARRGKGIGHRSSVNQADECWCYLAVLPASPAFSQPARSTVHANFHIYTD